MIALPPFLLKMAFQHWSMTTAESVDLVRHRSEGFKASVEEWGSKDCAAALDWLADRFPGAERIVVGHSVGGFVTGFVTNGTLIDKMLLVSAHTGYWRDYAAGARLPMYLLWHVLMPAITRVVGYFPGQRLHLLEDLQRAWHLNGPRDGNQSFGGT